MIIICDIDGVISNHEHRLHLAVDAKNADLRYKVETWDKFHDQAHLDPAYPEMVALLRGSATAGADIKLWTGRNERYRDRTIAWLNAHYVPWDQLLMRPQGSLLPSAELKGLWLQELLVSTIEGVPIIAFEDNARVVECFREHGVTACHVRPQVDNEVVI